MGVHARLGHFSRPGAIKVLRQKRMVVDENLVAGFFYPSL